MTSPAPQRNWRNRATPKTYDLAVAVSNYRAAIEEATSLLPDRPRAALAVLLTVQAPLR